METDFDLTLTDLGVCYTFNSGRHGDIMEVVDSGKDAIRAFINKSFQ